MVTVRQKTRWHYRAFSGAGFDFHYQKSDFFNLIVMNLPIKDSQLQTGHGIKNFIKLVFTRRVGLFFKD